MKLFQSLSALLTFTLSSSTSTTNLNLGVFQLMSNAFASEESCPDDYVPGTSDSPGSCPFDFGKVHAVAAIQAALDFNERNDRFNSKFGTSSDIMASCDKRINITVVDTGLVGRIAVSNFVDLMYTDNFELHGIIGAGTFLQL